MAEKTADDAARELLLQSESERKVHAMTVQALLARNALLTALETARAEQGLTKAELAARAGLEASSVRRLLTSKTANPTTENAFRLMATMGIKLEATLPTGERIELVAHERPALAAPLCEGSMTSAETLAEWPTNDQLIAAQLRADPEFRAEEPGAHGGRAGGGHRDHPLPRRARPLVAGSALRPRWHDDGADSGFGGWRRQPERGHDHRDLNTAWNRAGRVTVTGAGPRRRNRE